MAAARPRPAWDVSGKSLGRLGGALVFPLPGPPGPCLLPRVPAGRGCVPEHGVQGWHRQGPVPDHACPHPCWCPRRASGPSPRVAGAGRSGGAGRDLGARQGDRYFQSGRRGDRRRGTEWGRGWGGRGGGGDRRRAGVHGASRAQAPATPGVRPRPAGVPAPGRAVSTRGRPARVPLARNGQSPASRGSRPPPRPRPLPLAAAGGDWRSPGRREARGASEAGGGPAPYCVAGGVEPSRARSR